MKTKIKFVTGFIVISIILTSFYSFIVKRPKTFYYAYSEKIYLEPSDKALVIRYKVNKRKSNKNLSFKTKLNEDQFKWQDDSTVVIYALNTLRKDSLLYEVKRDDEFASVHPVYTVESGLEMYTTDEVLVKPLNDITQKQINEFHKKLGVKVIRSDENYQVIKVPSHLDAIEISKQYQESGMVLFSQPNFICPVELFQIPNDPYFNNQFYLNNTGQVFTDGHWGAVDCDIDAPEAWTITQGSNNIIVAVIDEGVTPDHPDLPNARQVILNNSNLADGDANNPSPTANNNHGNACAGIIAATRNNNEGIAGIAPNCRIMPMRVFNTDGTGVSADGFALAINTARQNGARVISNSWGYPDPNQNVHPAIVEAIRSAINAGCVVVFAAGNTAGHAFGRNGFVTFPANVNIPGVLTVGASDRDDLQADYSPTSALIDIVAPSHRAYPRELSNCMRNIDPSVQLSGIIGENLEIWSIDIPGNAGYNSFHGNNLPEQFAACNCVPLGCGTTLPNAGNNFLSYTARMGGTSAACPQVAAVAALILSINPNFTPQDVYDLLTTSADQIGGYVYTNGRSNEAGFGRLNACAAVMGAYRHTTTISGPSIVCSSGGTFVLNNVPPGCNITWTPSFNLIEVSGQWTKSFTVKALGGINPEFSINQPGASRAIIPPVQDQPGSSGWIEATITGPCGNYIVPRKTVWSGLPGFKPVVTGPTEIECGIWNMYLEQNGRAIYWSVPSSMQIIGPSGPGHKCTIKGLEFAAAGVIGTVSNECGSFTNILPVMITCGYLAVSPNPASSEIDVSILSTNEDKTVSQPITSEKPYVVNVYNLYGTKVLTTQKNTGSFKLSVSNLVNGTYFLEVTDGENTYKKQITVKH